MVSNDALARGVAFGVDVGEAVGEIELISDLAVAAKSESSVRITTLVHRLSHAQKCQKINGESKIQLELHLRQAEGGKLSFCTAMGT